ncbi:hypothetical protein ACQKNX_22555 [Lysinibacillus sp. NPDC093712]|uniref:hypothetical protein n=1 Tax=Lysinibacillus sp. NPDC093712 TaxID=3390579 RepID=UPI003D051440
MTNTFITNTVKLFTDDKYKELINTKNNTPRFTISFIRKLIDEKLQITPTSFRILFKLISFTDVTGEIHAGEKLSEIEDTMVVRKDTFIQALDRLIEYNFIILKDGHYFLASDLFTSYQSESTNDRFTYFDNYAVLQNDALMGQLTLNDMRLLLHMYANRSPHMYSRTRITNLYKNKFLKSSKGLEIFECLQDLVKSLSKLAYLELIELKLSYSTKYCTLLKHQNKLTEQLALMVQPDMSIAQIESIILSYYERDIRKKLGHNTSSYYLIDYRMPKTLYDSKMQNQANFAELRLLCDAYNISFDEIRDSEQLGYVVGNKNILYKLAGDIGSLIYKQAINDLFNDHKERVSSFVVQKKLANVLVDFYILPKIEKLIINFSTSATIDKSTLDYLGYFYLNKAADERLMLFVLENEESFNVMLKGKLTSLNSLCEQANYLWQKSYSTDMQNIAQNKILLFDDYKLLVKDVFKNQILYDTRMVQVHLDNRFLLQLKMQEKEVVEEKVKRFNFAAKSLKNAYKMSILKQELSSLEDSFSNYADTLINDLHDKIFVHSDETPMSVEEIYDLTDKEIRDLFNSRRPKIHIWANEYIQKIVNPPTESKKVPFYNWLEERD